MKNHPRKNLKITQKDVADAAGVSQALVSLVLSGVVAGEVTQERRMKIIKVANELGYHPKKTKLPKTGQRLLACVSPVVTRGHHKEEWIYDAYEDFYHRIQRGLVEAAQVKGYNVMVYLAGDDVQQLTRWLSEWNAEGVIWNCGKVELFDWVSQRLPVVQIERRLRFFSDSVLVNQEEVVQLAIDHLRSKGHRRIGFMPGGTTDYLSLHRKRAYLDCMEAAGDEPLVVNLKEVVESVEKMRRDRPTAILAADGPALRLQKNLLAAGYRLPDDLSLVGVDNLSACQFTHPALTSVDLNCGEMARNAIELIDARINNRSNVPLKIEVTPRLVIRESVTDLLAQSSIVSPSAI